jgi:hypothetical protein
MLIRSVKRKKIQYLKEFKRDPLFHQTELKKGLLEELINVYRNSTLKETVKRAIILLLASYERRTIEAQIQAVYSAIEAIVNSLSKNHGIYSCISKEKTRELLRSCQILFAISPP